MNLVAVSDDPERESREGEVLGDVSVAHPARILRLLESADTPSESVRVSVSARCTIPLPGRGQVCSEEIVVRAARRASFVPIVASLLVPDVPTVVLWHPGIDLEDVLLLPLADLADRVVIDTSAEAEPVSALARWYELMFSDAAAERSFAGTTLAGDLSWTRLGAWRSLLGSAVQAPDMRPLLSSATSLAIELGESAMAQGLLYASWFASRIGWKLRSARRTERGFTLQCSGEERGSHRQMEISRSGSGVGEGLAGVVLADGTACRVEIRRTATAGCAHVVRLHDGVRTEEHVHYPEASSPVALLVHELEILEHDEPYEAGMQWCGSLVRELLR